MSQIKIEFEKCADELSCGTSKLFGRPDVSAAKEFEIPTYDCYGDDFDMTFIAQINCEELAEFNGDGMLPDKGMLYFFYNMAEMPATPNIEDAAAVLYDPNPGEFEKLELCDEEGEDISLPEYSLCFSYDSDSEHMLLPEMPDDCADEFEGYEEDAEFESEYESDRDDDVILLQIDSFDAEDISVDFKGGTLCFLISREKLADRDFSDVRVMII